ncbi:hypothetical protein LINPERPRIM_LOCUS25116 [Linum perenne]
MEYRRRFGGTGDKERETPRHSAEFQESGNVGDDDGFIGEEEG